MFSKPILAFSFLLCLVVVTRAGQPLSAIKSPDGKIEVQLFLNGEGEATYTVLHSGKIILKPSGLGLVREDADFTKGLSFLSSSAVQTVADRYEMINAKKKNILYKANKKVFQFRNGARETMSIVFQVSNDGVAFRYLFTGNALSLKTIVSENTGFHFDATTKAWLQPMQVSKTGWEQTNPAYEEHYEMGIPVGKSSTYKVGWVYPALFNVGDTWVAITEAAVDGAYCATRLQSESPDGYYRIGFPDKREVMTENGLLPKVQLPFASPWRVIAVGSLKTITESTLGTDLAVPAQKGKATFAKPGKATWSWINSKDDFIVYDEQKKYVDFAARMKWEYCLIDVNWDQKIGYEKIKELADYAATKGVGLLLWYNSAGDWNTVKYTPKNKLLTHESRKAEFSRLKTMGIKGVKIDFFAGDGQSVMAYYHDILRDAAEHELMVNFHGATLPRGWHRTYPHLMTVEAVRGFEMITFSQDDADKAATHCAMLPFTRNLFDPMDFTPMNLYKIQTRIKRKTSAAFELATAVLFQSGIQHFAESPEGMVHVPAEVQQFLQGLPTSWDDIKFIEGFPGKYVVMARKAGARWYISGINAEASERTVQLPLSTFGKKSAWLIMDSEAGNTLFTTKKEAVKTAAAPLTIGPNKGFVMVVE